MDGCRRVEATLKLTLDKANATLGEKKYVRYSVLHLFLNEDLNLNSISYAVTALRFMIFN